ncbi:MAG: FAD-binding protein [Clostridia bacterium]|jgi:fumarate reductase (CoM/CoB) subunit A|nr:FAD-binding protein [Clostridia bacterium]MBT7122814.1 FAD-binding protein [Clostridia bacterium]
MKIKYSIDTEVLVIGSGGGGIKASIEASELGTDVLLVSEKKFGTSGSTFYPGVPGWGMCCVLYDSDSESEYLSEILEAGSGAADPKLSKILTENATQRFRDLEGYGLQFAKISEDEYASCIPCFGKNKRGATTYGLNKIRKVMWQQLMSRGVNVRNGVTVVSLVVRDGVCAGAVVIDETDNFCFIKAKSTVLATGGACGLYKYSLATNEQTGDGYLMALEAGARLINLEFIQFIPGITKPVSKTLFQEKNLDTFPKITNRNGKEFLYDYLPDGVSMEKCLTQRAKHGPFTNVDASRYMDIAMIEEWRAGRAFAEGGLHMQYPKEVLTDKRHAITSWLDWMSGMGIDVVGEGFDILPHAQGFNGGVYIDENAGAGVRGLFAAGETAGGPHGADRLGGAAIAATQVFGKIAGQSAAKHAKGTEHSDVSTEYAEQYMSQLLQTNGGGVVDIGEATARIKEIMWNCGSLVRSEERSKEGLSKLEQIEKSFSPLMHFESGADIRKVSKLRSLIKIGKLLLNIMDYRKESRGPHYRIDYPDIEEEFRGAIVSKYKDGQISLELIDPAK